MNTIKWEDFKGFGHFEPEWQPTSIECPKCNHLLEINVGVISTSMPPKMSYRCPICGWKGAK